MASVEATAKSEGTDTEFLIWFTLEWFEMGRWLTPLVGDDLVEFAGDTLTSVLVKAVEISPGCVGELPVSFTHRCRVPSHRDRTLLSGRRYCGFGPHESRFRWPASLSDLRG